MHQGRQKSAGAGVAPARCGRWRAVQNVVGNAGKPLQRTGLIEVCHKGRRPQGPQRRALLGPADDGGWWALAQRRHRPGIFDGVPMSAVDTGTRQLAALRAAGARVVLAPNLRDIDRADDLAAAAEAAPQTRTAALVAALRSAGRLPGVAPFGAG